MSQQTSTQAKYILTVCLTLIFCVVVFGLWLPRQVRHDTEPQATVADQGLGTSPEAKKSELSQELLDYFKHHQLTNQSETDTLTEADLTERFEEISEDYITTAEQIIQSRFKSPEALNASAEDFTVPKGLEEQVKFWTHIFGVYTNDHVIFYHSDDVGVVYSVLDFSQISSEEGGLGAIKNRLISEEGARIKQILSHLDGKLKREKVKDGSYKTTISQTGLTDEEKRIAKLLASSHMLETLDEKTLLENLAYRNGFSKRIKSALQASGAYMEEMQRIFRERGLPPELTMIPFIESAFNLEAYSRAGAAGIWQFIEATGKRYLRIDEYTDERYDPILAAYAAATHLANEYEFLGGWALTINAYNTGPGRIQQAMKQLQTTDIANIIHSFKGSGYGFDSRNYFPEFLAMLDVYRNKEYYFGDLKMAEKQEFAYVALPSPMNIKELARVAGINLETFADYNQGLKDEVINGDVLLPKGYLIKIPPTSKDNMLLAMQEQFDSVRYASHHVVETGDSLKSIANRYALPIKQLAQFNGVLSNEDLTPGSIVRLPSRVDNVELTMDASHDQMVIPDQVHTPVF
ncbi:MAG TPA: transglycosylase SLT domain-containing protein [bacterium]|nr:transglycosylase SLT domain-containing protein [bacterium]